MPRKDLINELDEKLDNSVRIHMISDAPVAVLASGGLDSSIIASFSKKYNPHIDLYHANVIGPQSELEGAREVADTLDLKLFIENMSGEDYVRDLALVAYYNEVPSAYHPNDVPFHLISKLAKENRIKVLLTGEGADELFFGYSWMVYNHGKRLFHNYLQKISSVCKKIPGLGLVDKFIGKESTISLDINSRGFLSSIRQEANEAYSFIDNPLERESLVDCIVYTGAHLSSLLHRNDRMGMMEGLESRIPYLENELLKFAVNLPMKYKFSCNILHLSIFHPLKVNKWVLREAAKNYLPKSISSRSKKGFPVDALSYFDISPDFFNDGFLCNELEIRNKEIKGLWEEAPNNFKWNLFALEIWGRIFICGLSPSDVSIAVKSKSKSYNEKDGEY